MNRISLKYRIAVTIFILEALMVTLVLWKTQSVSYNAAKNILHDEEKVFLNTFSNMSSHALTTSEYGELQTYINEFRKDPHIEQIFVTNFREQIIAGTNPELLSRELPLMEDDDKGYWRSRRILPRTGKGGALYIKFSKAHIKAAYHQSLTSGIEIAVISMIVIAIVGMMIGYFLVKRLDRLNYFARQMSKGNINIVSDISGSDEIAELSDAFNNMAQNIKYALNILKDSEQRYRRIIETAQEGVIILDDNAGITYVNKRITEMLGRSEKEIIGRTPFDLLLEEDRIKAQQSFERRRRGIKEIFDIRFLKKNGSVLWATVSANPIIDADGRFVGSFSMLTDITERKQAEKTLRDSEERYRLLFENAGDAILIADLDGNLIEANKRAVEFFGYERDDLLSTHFSKLHPPEELKKNIAIFRDTLKKGIDFLETLAVRKDGSIIPVEITASIVEYGGQKVNQAIFRDVTERKKMEEQIRTSLEDKEVLLREIHHRVKNNLQVIFSMLNLQVRTVAGKKTAEALMEIKDRVRAILLVHEKLYAGKNLADIEFKNYAKSLTTELLKSYGTQDRRVDLKFDMQDIPLGIDTAIPCGLIINELVSNALKYAFPENRDGEIKIGLHVVDKEIRLVVSDNGIGLPEGMDMSDTKTLGLQLVNILANDQLRGRIEVDSSKDKGTEYRIVFEEARQKGRM